MEQDGQARGHLLFSRAEDVGGSLPFLSVCSGACCLRATRVTGAPTADTTRTTSRGASISSRHCGRAPGQWVSSQAAGCSLRIPGTIAITGSPEEGLSNLSILYCVRLQSVELFPRARRISHHPLRHGGTLHGAQSSSSSSGSSWVPSSRYLDRTVDRK